ncbi:DUF2092 domain-containing protein [Azospirillum sp. YIM DDC1]|uniref:DUF2092 domain-containing protein n=1 Tax=Azospirillum aestuarii TaxID=2802052 RepID=A0ABS1I499_9PROT|nr:DUF2092 domain-containing protein [Azospirillum aestuarii]MBK4721493.1 DUF2092 domain-containing protein [Azospirillum aestuarii]
MNGPRWLIRSALCPMLCAFALVGPAFGAEAPPPDTSPQAVEQNEPQDALIDDEAMTVLERMADTLAQAQRFTVTIRASYDVVQDTGEKITFGERRAVTLNRPDGLRVEAQESDGRRSLVTFDGKAISVFNADENVYGQIERAGTIDDAVRYLVQDLRVRLPLALLLVSTLPDELEQRLQALDYVERDTLTAVPTDHLAGRTEDIDFQIWIATEGPPLPQRVTITYKADEGEPQYRADFSDWNLNPDVQPAQLAFHPPDGAERIPVMVRVRRTAAGSSEGAPK